MLGWIRLGWSLALKMHGILEGERECGKRRSGSQLWGSPQSAEQVQEGAGGFVGAGAGACWECKFPRGTYPRPTESGTPGVWPRKMCFNKPSWEF